MVPVEDNSLAATSLPLAEKVTEDHDSFGALVWLQVTPQSLDL